MVYLIGMKIVEKENKRDCQPIGQKMIYQHWRNLTFFEQMAHIGSEVERAIAWRGKGNNQYSKKAAERGLELLFLTIECAQNDVLPRFAGCGRLFSSASGRFENKKRLKELTRLRETLIDYFFGQNRYGSSDDLWRKYFYAFNYAARLNKT